MDRHDFECPINVKGAPDTISITKLDTAGAVVSIGLRTTRIQTGDNRMITVPNSVLGESEVINYNLPDPRYRAEIDFIAVGESFCQIKSLIEKTVRGIEGVLADKPVDVIYLFFGGTGREIRVRWWIDSINNLFHVQTKVLVALEKALDEAGIETPNLTYDLHVH
jgi:small-conductance mechanosensitive channel